MQNKPSFVTAYAKGIAIIKSCATFEQLACARRYMKSFFNMFIDDRDIGGFYSLLLSEYKKQRKLVSYD